MAHDNLDENAFQLNSSPMGQDCASKVPGQGSCRAARPRIRAARLVWAPLLSFAMLAGPAAAADPPITELQLHHLAEDYEDKPAILKALVFSRCVDFDLTPENAKFLKYIPDAVMEVIIECRSRVGQTLVVNEAVPPASIRLKVEDRFSGTARCHLFLDVGPGAKLASILPTAAPRAVVEVKGATHESPPVLVPAGSHSLSVFCDPINRNNTTWKSLEPGKAYEVFARRQKFMGSITLLESSLLVPAAPATSAPPPVPQGAPPHQ